MGRWQKDKGSDWFIATAAAGATYPTGNGGSTTTDTDSIFEDTATSKREGVLVSVHVEAGTTCVIADHASTEILTVVGTAGRSHNEVLDLRFLNGLEATSTGGDSLIIFEYAQ